MPRKRRITKYITIEQMDFLKYLETEEIQVFSIEDTKNFDFHGEITNELLENLTKKNFLTRIERGKYCRANFRDENVIGTFLAKESAVAYWSALNLNNLNLIRIVINESQQGFWVNAPYKNRFADEARTSEVPAQSINSNIIDCIF